MKSTLRTAKGQSLVEFALILPLFLLLVVGMTEFGRAWMTKNILTGAAREGARFAAVQPSYNFTDIENRVISVLDNTGITPTVIVTLPVNSVKVDVTSTYSAVITGFISNLPTSLTGTATMRRERY